MAKSALDFATEIEKALASGSWRHTELANRIEMYVETRLEARAPEQGGEMRFALQTLLNAIEDEIAERPMSMRLTSLNRARAIATQALLARESAEPCPLCGDPIRRGVVVCENCAPEKHAEPAEERGPEVDALLWMTERLMCLSVALTMRGWLAEYRATGGLAVRNASGAAIDKYPKEVTR